MGIRPAFHLLVGFEKKNIQRDPTVAKLIDITTHDDPDHEVQYYVDQDRSDLAYKQIGVPGFNFITIKDILYNGTGDGEYECKRVVGMEMRDRHNQYDDDVMRFMAAGEEKYMTDGYSILLNRPNISDWSRRAYRITDEDIICNRAVPSVFENMVELSRIEWKRAIFYLAQAGWHVTERDLHYILVWDWS